MTGARRANCEDEFLASQGVPQNLLLFFTPGDCLDVPEFVELLAFLQSVFTKQLRFAALPATVFCPFVGRN